MRSVILWTVFLFAACVAMAQSPDMGAWLNDGQPQQRVQHLMALGVDQKISESVSGDGNAVDWLPLRSLYQKPLAILFLPCNLDDAYLYLLQYDGKLWQVSDHTVFDCHYDMSVSIELWTIRRPSVDEIIVHHECSGHGTGYSEQHFNIYSIARGKLKLSLDTKEVVELHGIPARFYDLSQHSTFNVVVGTAPYPRLIEEIRRSTLNGRLFVRRRVFYWDTKAKRYSPSKFWTE